MSDKFKGKYRIESARLQNWDYANDGAYFITICTKNRDHFFGEIENIEFYPTELGRIAEKYWLEIPNIFPLIELGNFVIMPNHVHGILIINKNNGIVDNDGVDGFNRTDAINCRDAINRVSTSRPSTSTSRSKSSPSPTAPTEINGGFAGEKNPMFHENISRIIRWYKGRCTFEMRKTNQNFNWQTRFYDIIIRDAKSFENIQNCIANNPLNWNKDKFFENEC